jgi:hypothetical protein
MRKYLLLLWLPPLLFGTCQFPDKPDEATNREQIAALETNAEKSAYLVSLWEEDQAWRTGKEQEVVSAYGRDSEEYETFVEDYINGNRQIFLQLQTYLSIHGYPDQPDQFDELALNAFPTIIGHHHHFAEQLPLFHHLYEAYLQGYCALDDVVWVLGEMYESKNRGQRYAMSTTVYSKEQEFLELSEALGLELVLR